MGPKIRDLHTFGVEFENTIVIFEICVLEFVLFQILVQKQKSCKKIHEKTKMPKFGTKNALFGYFWLEFENNSSIFDINTPNLSNCKIS